MALAFVSISAFTFLKVDRGQRTFFYLVQALLATASIAYFCLASDLGATPVTVEFIHGNWAHTGQGRDGLPTRQIWYVRYIDWTITTPLLLLTLLLTAPVPLSTVFMTIFMDLVMIITGLIGALVVSVYKWGFFAFGCAALFWIYYVLFGPARIAAKEGGEDLHKAYIVGTSILSFLWFLYPICWGLADGGNAIHPDSEMVFYGVLDVLAKPSSPSSTSGRSRTSTTAATASSAARAPSSSASTTTSPAPPSPRTAPAPRASAASRTSPPPRTPKRRARALAGLPLRPDHCSRISLSLLFSSRNMLSIPRLCLQAMITPHPPTLPSTRTQSSTHSVAAPLSLFHPRPDFLARSRKTTTTPTNPVYLRSKQPPTLIPEAPCTRAHRRGEGDSKRRSGEDIRPIAA